MSNYTHIALHPDTVEYLRRLSRATSFTMCKLVDLALIEFRNRHCTEKTLSGIALAAMEKETIHDGNKKSSIS
jgi:hypothetical protein